MSTTQGTGIAALSNYIKNTLLPSMTTIRLMNIFDHELTDLGGFPSATVTLQEIIGDYLDNTRNKRVFRFMIRVFIDRAKQNFGSSKAETILRSVADELVLKIDADTTLGGNCIDVKAFPAKFGYINRANNDIRLMEITLDCIDAVTWR